jgi:hypothetical protein
MGPGLCQAKPPSHTTQPLTFGIGFIAALVLPLSTAQLLVYKMELPTCLRQACMYARSGEVSCVCSCGVPLGSRRRGSWLSYICISSCHSSFLVVWWFRPFLHNIHITRYRILKYKNEIITFNYANDHAIITELSYTKINNIRL